MGMHRGMPRGRIVPLCLSTCAWVFLWTYLRKSLYAPMYETLPMAGASWVYPLLVALTVALAVMGAWRQRALVRLLDRSALVVGLGLAGSACLAVLTWGQPVLAGASAGFADVVVYGCLVVAAVSFCVVFLAWVCQAHRQSFEAGLEVEVVVQLAAVFASFVLTTGASDGTPRLDVVNVVGLVVAGACLAGVRRLEGVVSGEGEAAMASPVQVGIGTAGGQDTPAGGLGRALPWLALLGASFLVVGMLGYAHYFDDGFEGLGPWEIAVDVLTLVTLGVMAAFSVYANRTVMSRRRIPIVLVLGVVLAAFAVFFVAMLSFSMQGALLYGLARFIRRVSRVAAFLTVLVMVYQYALPPIGSFVLAFLIPSLLPKPVQMTLASADLGFVGAVGQDYVLVALMTTGFFLTACLVVFCLLNMDGRLARGLIAGSGEEGGSGDSLPRGAVAGGLGTSNGPSHRATCEEIGRERGLTRREVDVLDLFSQGRSAQEAALELCISTNTVNTHAMTLYRKLDVHSKRELAELVEARRSELASVDM